MARKDLLDISALDRTEIEHLLEQSIPFKELFTRSVKKVPALKGKSVLMLFYEPSTRTHSSFEVAAKRLSADVTNFDVAHSSITKGESVRERWRLCRRCALTISSSVTAGPACPG